METGVYRQHYSMSNRLILIVMYENCSIVPCAVFTILTQVMDMQSEHEGDYTCIAQNDLGMDKAMGRIIVIENEYGKKPVL